MVGHMTKAGYGKMDSKRLTYLKKQIYSKNNLFQKTFFLGLSKIFISGFSAEIDGYLPFCNKTQTSTWFRFILLKINILHEFDEIFFIFLIAGFSFSISNIHKSYISIGKGQAFF